MVSILRSHLGSLELKLLNGGLLVLSISHVTLYMLASSWSNEEDDFAGQYGWAYLGFGRR